MNQLLSISQSANHLGKSERSIRRMIHCGDLPAYRIGGSVRLRLADIEQYIESQRIDRQQAPNALKELVARAVRRAKAKSRIKAGGVDR